MQSMTLFEGLQGTALMEYAELWGVTSDIKKGRPDPVPIKHETSPVMMMASEQQPGALGFDMVKRHDTSTPCMHHHADVKPSPQAYLQRPNASLNSPSCGMQCSQLGPASAGARSLAPPFPSLANSGPTPSHAGPGSLATGAQGSASCCASVEMDEETARVNQAAGDAAASATATIERARQAITSVTSNPAALDGTRHTPVASSSQGGAGGGGGGSSSGRRKSMRVSGDGTTASRTSSIQAVLGSGGGATGGKGLRQFAVMVCDQVRERGRTTYNEVADVLVGRLVGESEADGKDVPDDKTIRRRVYDALNVLMALGIIEREKKDIIWRGLPQLNFGGAANGAQAAGGAGGAELPRLRAERMRRISDVDRKQAYLQELVDQHAALCQLISRNAACPPGPSGGMRIQLPFIILQARPNATVEVKISEDMQDVQFDIYDSAVEIHDDSGVIKHMASAGSGGGSRAGQPAPETPRAAVAAPPPPAADAPPTLGM